MQKLDPVAYASLATCAVILCGACGQSVQPPPVRNFDRPQDAAFACFGDLRLNEGDPDNADAPVRRMGMPLAACERWLTGEGLPGQQELIPPEFYSFVLQTARGTVAVVALSASTVIDTDPLTPGKNDIPIGSLPIGLVADNTGCHMVSANAGSCDLSSLDVTAALDFTASAAVSRIPVTTPSGERLVTKPRAIVALPQRGEVGFACPDRPEGKGYIAYPACDLVALVDLGTGMVEGGIAFDDDGIARIATEADFDCPAQCGDGSLTPTAHHAPADGGVGGDGGVDGDAGPVGVDEELAGKPVVLTMHEDEDGRTRLFVGGEAGPLVTVVELDEAGAPTGISQIQLQGDVGIREIAVSPREEMGGDGTVLTPRAGEFQFAYVITTDASVRVVSLDDSLECDTQVDPRYLREEDDIEFLACMPVGDPRTPPRRADADSPGIKLPGVPLGVAFFRSGPLDRPTEPTPLAMSGLFAFVSTANGLVWVINVDDDNLRDLEDPEDPLAIALPLALPHQPRDFVRSRNGLALSCNDPTPDPFELGPRQVSEPARVIDGRTVATEKSQQLPYIRSALCTSDDGAGNTVEAPVSEFSFAAPQEVREDVFPDLLAVQSESWFLIWEGALSIDGGDVAIDGPSIRKAELDSYSDALVIKDPSAPFCSIGVEEWDVAAIVGCDPTRGDAQCAVGETCFVHPDSPSVITTGLCVPEDSIDFLSANCRDFFVTRRRYTVTEVRAEQVIVEPRARVLRTTPLDGCESDDQCAELALVERELQFPEPPAEYVRSEEDQDFSWECRSDNSRSPGPDRCLMTCESSEDCEMGLACSRGVCVEGTIPPPDCHQAIQRYQLRAGESFVLVGERTGFLHNRVLDPESRQCVVAPDAHPLKVGRVPLRAEPCDDDGDPLTGPNPCSTTVQQSELYVPYEFSGTVCQPTPLALRNREAPAIRVQNPALRFHVVDTETSGDLLCNNDREGELPPYSSVYPGYQVSVEIAGGFLPMFVANLEAALPRKILPTPDGHMWVLDEGDASNVTQGRIYTLVPTDAGSGFALQSIL